jgi:hypothetical protein
MHHLHKLGYAKIEANYHAYHQTLIKDGTANGATSNVGKEWAVISTVLF